MSARPGITLRPDRSRVRAPAGTETSLAHRFDPISPDHDRTVFERDAARSVDNDGVGQGQRGPGLSGRGSRP